LTAGLASNPPAAPVQRTALTLKFLLLGALACAAMEMLAEGRALE